MVYILLTLLVLILVLMGMSIEWASIIALGVLALIAGFMVLASFWKRD